MLLQLLSNFVKRYGTSMSDLKDVVRRFSHEFSDCRNTQSRQRLPCPHTEIEHFDAVLGWRILGSFDEPFHQCFVAGQLPDSPTVASRFEESAEETTGFVNAYIRRHMNLPFKEHDSIARNEL